MMCSMRPTAEQQAAADIVRREHGVAPGRWPDIPSTPGAAQRFALEATARIALAGGESRVATAMILRLATHELPASAYRRMLKRDVGLILRLHKKELLACQTPSVSLDPCVPSTVRSK